MCNYKISSVVIIALALLIPQIVSAPVATREAIPVAKRTAIPIEFRGNEVIELIRPRAEAVPLPGEINWTKQVIKAKGWGVIDTAMPNRAQAKLMARGAAIAVAQRNLLEIVKGVRVASEVKVQDYMGKSDYIYKRVEGVIRGAQMVGEPVEKEGIVEVEMAIEFHGPKGLVPGIWPEIKPIIPEWPPLTPKDKNKLKEISAVAIDFSNTLGMPSVFPKIVDKDGNVLFDLAWYYDPNDPDFQKLIKIWNATEEELKELGIWDNPYVIKARRAIGGNVIISDEDKEKVNWLKKCFSSLVKMGKLIWAIL
jgi:hypothetical protein